MTDCAKSDQPTGDQKVAMQELADQAQALDMGYSVVISRQVYDALLHRLENPQGPNQKLKELMSRYRAATDR